MGRLLFKVGVKAGKAFLGGTIAGATYQGLKKFFG